MNRRESVRIILASGLTSFPALLIRRSLGSMLTSVPRPRMRFLGVNVRIQEVAEDLIPQTDALGTGWIRTEVRWDRVEGRDNFDFSSVLSGLKLIRENGMSTLAILDYGHP